MRNTRLSFTVLISCVLLWSASASAASSNSCTGCHTNDAVMKSLYKPPAMPVGEGEG